MNMELIREFSKDEILTTLKQMHSTKDPGLNDMFAIFLKKYWSVMGNNVTNMVLNVLNYKMSIARINKTNITLVLKTKTPTRMIEFHPTSRSSVVYKLIAKLLANHLKAILLQIIIKNQSVFLSERLIMDNVLVSFKIMHYLNNKKDGKESFMALKLEQSL